jgi:tetratricopeptide (TPR) repeat protein
LTFPQSRKETSQKKQVEMSHKSRSIEKPHSSAKFLPILVLGAVLFGCAEHAIAQSSELLPSEGRIRGTVLLKAGERPASQVAVRLKSHVAGIFHSMLTDLEGHFEVRGLPRGTYEIVVDEPGYESAQTSAQLDGVSAELVIYLKPSHVEVSRRNGDTISVRELKIPHQAQEEFREGLERVAKNDPAGGLLHFQKAAQEFPGYYEAQYHAGAVQMKMGQRVAAMQAFQTAIDLSGGRYAHADFGLGYLLYLEGRASEAEGVIRRGLDVDEDSPDGYAILGMTLLRLERIEEAEKYAREAIARDANLEVAYLVLADVHARRHEYQQQLRALETYLNLDPSGPASERVRQARGLVLQIVASSSPQK